VYCIPYLPLSWGYAPMSQLSERLTVLGKKTVEEGQTRPKKIVHDTCVIRTHAPEGNASL
jgi:hypothetical protein